MRQSCISPSNFAVISSLSSCAGLKLLTAGQQVHCDAVKWGLDLDTSVSNVLVKMYGECGAMSDYWKVFNSMAEHDEVSWNTMMGVMASSQTPISEIVKVFNNMMRGGLIPNIVGMPSREHLFTNMSDRRDAISWNSMISGYIYNGNL